MVLFHLVCLSCRRSKKTNGITSQACTECGSLMYNLGKLFAAPRRKDGAGWLKIELMIANGWDGTNWPVSLEMSLCEVKDSLRANYQQTVARHSKAKMQMGIERRQTLARARSRKARTTLKKQRLEEERQRLYQEQIMKQVASTSQDFTSDKASN